MFTPRNQVLALNQTLQAVYNASYDNALKNRWSAEVANEINGAGVIDIKEFLVEDLKIRSGPGTEFSDLRTHSMAITHEQMSGGFQVRDRDFTTQSAMQIKTDAAAGLGAVGALHGQKQLLALINSATAKAYDGLTFWHNAHFVNYKDASQGTFPNTEAGKELTDDNVAAFAAQLESRVMADGTNRMIKAKWLLHPPSLKKKAHVATGAEFIGGTVGTTQNVVAKKSVYDITPVQVPGLAQVGGKDQWIIAGELEGGGTFARPFGISTLFAPKLTNYDSSIVPMLGIMQELEYLLTGDLAAFLGHPFLVHRGIVP